MTVHILTLTSLCRVGGRGGGQERGRSHAAIKRGRHPPLHSNLVSPVVQSCLFSFFFLGLVKRLCTLPFVPQDMLELAIEIFHDTLDEMGEESSVAKFSRRLVSYVKRNWLNGPFSIQDWNLFEIGMYSYTCIYTG